MKNYFWEMSDFISLNQNFSNTNAPIHWIELNKYIKQTKEKNKKTNLQQSLSACSIASPALIIETPQTFPPGDTPWYLWPKHFLFIFWVS